MKKSKTIRNFRIGQWVYIYSNGQLGRVKIIGVRQYASLNGTKSTKEVSYEYEGKDGNRFVAHPSLRFFTTAAEVRAHFKSKSEEFLKNVSKFKDKGFAVQI